ncbi:MAG: hypothetical protein KBT03_00385 [Bacteroidales bacterium]|nr:hypothetical protein [Candidatus Scybalousia scybalohippi]
MLEVTSQCLENIQNYKGEDDKVYEYQKTLFNFLFNNNQKTFTVVPSWTYKGVGIITRLEELKGIAEEVLKDDKVEDRDVKLSLTTHSELFKLLNKSKDFQPFVFGNGH